MTDSDLVSKVEIIQQHYQMASDLLVELSQADHPNAEALHKALCEEGMGYTFDTVAIVHMHLLWPQRWTWASDKTLQKKASSGLESNDVTVKKCFGCGTLWARTKSKEKDADAPVEKCTRCEKRKTNSSVSNCTNCEEPNPFMKICNPSPPDLDELRKVIKACSVHPSVFDELRKVMKACMDAAPEFFGRSVGGSWSEDDLEEGHDTVAAYERKDTDTP